MSKGPWWAPDEEEEQEPSANPLLHAALHYHGQGWYPIPVRRETKVPMLSNWPEAAKRLDYYDIERYWKRDDPPNIGLVTGISFDVLDIDGEDGKDSLIKHLNGEPWEPTGPMAITGGGGRHVLFQKTGYASAGRLLPNVDFRGKGGQIVAPPSIHETGNLYRWSKNYPRHLPLPLAPHWLIKLLESRKAPPPSETPVSPSPDYGSVAEALHEAGIPYRMEGGRAVFECPTERHSDSDWSAKTGLGDIADRKWLCFGCGSWGDAENIRQNRHVLAGLPYENVTLKLLSSF